MCFNTVLGHRGTFFCKLWAQKGCDSERTVWLCLIGRVRWAKLALNSQEKTEVKWVQQIQGLPVVMFYVCFCERVCVFSAHRCESVCVLKNVCIFMVKRGVCEPVCIVCVWERVYKSASWFYWLTQSLNFFCWLKSSSLMNSCTVSKPLVLILVYIVCTRKQWWGCSCKHADTIRVL